MDKIEKDFWKYHKEFPQVYEEMKRISLSLKRNGREYYGINAVAEIVRFNSLVTTTNKPYKFPNTIRPLYSRLLMRQEPELMGFFKTRRRQSEIFGDGEDDFNDDEVAA